MWNYSAVWAHHNNDIHDHIKRMHALRLEKKMQPNSCGGYLQAGAST